MPSVGFRLYADSTELERELSKLGTAEVKLRQGFGSLGGFLRGTFAATIVYGFVKAIQDSIEHAQALRDAFRDGGPAIDANTAAVARLGDAIGNLKTGAIGDVVGGLTKVIGGLARFGEWVGEKQARYTEWLSKLLGANSGISAKNIGISEGAEENAQMLERGKAAAKELGDFRKKNAMEAADDAHKLKLLTEENARLIADQAKYQKGSKEHTELQLQIEKNIAEIRKTGNKALQDQQKTIEASRKETDKWIADLTQFLEKQHAAEGRVAGARSDLETAREDRGKMSLRELASLSLSPFSPGVATDIGSQANQAREALDFERKGEEARRGGRAEEAMGYFSRSDQIKGGLTALRSSEREDPFKQLKNALKESEEQLKALNEKIGGVEP